ncbi:CLUMA_CG015032, isoform A [Clunio marinus]|uniref:CLUMA_CG015032, isoform A n=1 Tax=Clunio marinus TaxID=568069 RepID=A0A1J1INT1_9DIPT|nr:CLUMA_CG015032, isoform A [Clunio marinus]
MKLKARNKPADGSSHLKQREKTPTPGHKGGHGQAKATAHSAKQPPPGKHGSLSLSKGSLQKTPSSDRDLYLPPPPKAGARNKKNKKKVYDLYVKIDIVSKIKTIYFIKNTSKVTFN